MNIYEFLALICFLPSWLIYQILIWLWRNRMEEKLDRLLLHFEKSAIILDPETYSGSGG